jgi:hypothetical protein
MTVEKWRCMRSNLTPWIYSMQWTTPPQRTWAAARNQFTLGPILNCVNLWGKNCGIQRLSTLVMTGCFRILGAGQWPQCSGTETISFTENFILIIHSGIFHFLENKSENRATVILIPSKPPVKSLNMKSNITISAFVLLLALLHFCSSFIICLRI